MFPYSRRPSNCGSWRVAPEATVWAIIGTSVCFAFNEEDAISTHQNAWRNSFIGIVAFLFLGSAALAQTAAPPAAPTTQAAPGRGGARGPAPSATQPMLQPRTDNRHASFLEIAKKGDIDVLFIGDSITDNWRGVNARNGGAKIWEANFAPLKAANFGIGADRTQHVLFRVQNGELEGFKAKLIVMMIGTNNLQPDGSRNTPADAVEGIKLIVKEIRDRQPQAKLLLLGVFPRAASATDPFRPLIKQVNDQISKLDDGKNIYYMDIGEKFLQPDGSLSPEIMPDYLHPNEKGYQIWADAILPKVKELMAVK